MLDETDVAAVQRFLQIRKLSTTPAKPCECGCGTMIPALRKDGRVRRFIKGHKNRRPGVGRGARRNFWMGDTEWAELVAAAEARDISASAFIRAAVKEKARGDAERKAGG